MKKIPCWARSVGALAWFVLAVAPAPAQVQLTTIEDTVYRADGQTFSGIVMIEWRSFLAADSTSVAAYSKNVRVVNGVLKVSLVPTTTASAGAFYLVRYNVNGRIQFTEYWGVKPSVPVLKLKDVRLVGPPVSGQVAAPSTAAGPVEVTDVIGLTEELAARPKKSLGYTPSRAVVTNANGDLDAAMGEPTDCVRVNGTTGPCAVGSGPAFIDSEAPAGLVNGTNGTFTLANPPNPATSLTVFRNGLLQRVGLDYNLTTNTITFLSNAIPQPGDLLTASYRMAGTGGQTGSQAGGALAGYFPAPSIAPGAIGDQHISPSAAIQETKLALNFPTHANANDPSAEQKGALAGTAGNPSSTNRYVTDQDQRLTNARPPTGHGLLGGGHFDTNPGAVSRGDLIVGMGTAPTLWSRLPLGAPNRCLISNGFDAVWNACLYAGFPAGSIPFADASGTLSHNGSRLSWDNTTRRLGVGMNAPVSTLTVQDATSLSGETTITVRAGEGQAAVPLQRWQAFGGTDVARVEADGALLAANVRAASTTSQAAWQETGVAADPAGAANGHMWYHSGDQARRTMEGGQRHTLPQVVCSTAGSATGSVILVPLGKCRIPVDLIRPGDSFEVRLQVSHEGSTVGFSYAVNWGGVSLVARSGVAGESAAAGRITALPSAIGVHWSWQTWGAQAALAGGAGSATLAAGTIDVEVIGQMAGGGSETITLRNLTVVRIPAQTNL